MDFQLKQRGRASMHFLADLAAASSRLRSKVDADLVAKGLDGAHWDENLDRRLTQADAALAASLQAERQRFIGEIMASLEAPGDRR